MFETTYLFEYRNTFFTSVLVFLGFVFATFLLQISCCFFNHRNLSVSQRHFVLQEQPCHRRNNRQVVKATFDMRLNILMHLTSFLGVCHNICSEFVLDIGRLKEISTTFRNSMKIPLNFIVNINQMRNNHESTYFNLIGHFFANVWHFQKCLLDFKHRYLSKYLIKILV